MTPDHKNLFQQRHDFNANRFSSKSQIFLRWSAVAAAQIDASMNSARNKTHFAIQINVWWPFQSSIKHSHLVFNPLSLSLSLSFASLYHSFVHLWANLTQNFYIICYLFPSDVIRISVYHLPTYPSVICYWYTRYLYLSFSLFLSLTLRTYIGTGSDPSNDCHSVLVVAAAVASGARIIIKWRPKIFPKSVFTSFSAMTVFLCLPRENAKRFLRFDFGETK